MGLRGIGAKPVKRPDKKVRAKKALWDPKASRVERIVQFIENLPVTSGKFAGQMFKVRPWQREIIEGIYGGADGKRHVRQALITMPRKNGKTGLTAALGLAHLCGPEAEERGQVYSAAAERNQAALIYNEMKAIISRVPLLDKRIAVKDFTKFLEDVETGSIFTALSSDANTKHGFSASCIIYDELAQAPNRKLYDALITSTGAREEPLTIIISTQSPDPNHIMSELVDYGQDVIEGRLVDPTFYAFIRSAPPLADPWSEETWYACNPALGDFRSFEEMKTFATQAQRVPAREATFRLLYLNQRINVEQRFVPRADWDACAKDFDLRQLRGRKCYGGLDLSSTGKNDLSALVLVFPFENGTKVALPFFWASEHGLEEAEKRDRVPYRLWASQGYLQTVPTRVLDYGFLCRKIGELSTEYQIECVAFDEWKIDAFIQKADEMHLNLTMRKHGQNYREMDPSIQALEDDILEWKLKHRSHPILDHHMDNVVVEIDAAGNRKFNKRKSTSRIDGAVALAMAEGVLTQSATHEKTYQVVFV